MDPSLLGNIVVAESTPYVLTPLPSDHTGVAAVLATTPYEPTPHPDLTGAAAVLASTPYVPTP